MKKLDNLFIIRSPLQLINALEAVEYFKLENNILVIIYNNTNNTNIQIDKLLKLYRWKDIIKVNKEQKKSKFFDYIKLIKKLRKQDYNYLFFGDFGSIYKLIIANLKKNQLWHIDDGVGTINSYNDILVTKKINKISTRMLRFMLFGLTINIKDNINLFTYFDLKPLEHTKIITNNLNSFKSKYLTESIADNKTYILGQPLWETNLLKQDDYFKYLDKIIKLNDNIIYIPHRTEIIGEKLKSYISDKFELREIGMPIELYFMENNIQPYHIISFITTAFFTLKKLYSDTKYSYVYIPSSKILEREDKVESIYKLIETLNIKKVC